MGSLEQGLQIKEGDQDRVLKRTRGQTWKDDCSLLAGTPGPMNLYHKMIIITGIQFLKKEKKKMLVPFRFIFCYLPICCNPVPTYML